MDRNILVIFLCSVLLFGCTTQGQTGEMNQSGGMTPPANGGGNVPPSGGGSMPPALSPGTAPSEMTTYANDWPAPWPKRRCWKRSIRAQKISMSGGELLHPACQRPTPFRRNPACVTCTCRPGVSRISAPLRLDVTTSCTRPPRRSRLDR